MIQYMVKASSISISSLSKFLVNDYFELEINLEDSKDLELKLSTNLNRHRLDYSFKKESSHRYTCRVKLTDSGFFKWAVMYRTSPADSWHRLMTQEENPVIGRIQVDPEWVSQAIVYNVFIRFFKGRVSQKDSLKPGEGGTFDDVKAHLDELQKMSINTLYLNPIHLIGELHRKYNMLDELPHYLQPGSPYSIKDFKSIDPELTYDKDTGKHLSSDPQQEFRDLIDEAHKRGMYVIMDLVFNHTAHDFVFQRIKPEWFLYKENITSLDDPYLYPDDMKQGKPWGDPKFTMSPYAHGVWWEDTAQLNWEYKIPDASNSPPKNTSLKEMWEYFKSIPKYWIRHFGVDGFRCDIAYRVPPKFWRECIAESRHLAHKVKTNMSQDVIFIAESHTDDLRELHEAGFTCVYGDYENQLSRPLQTKGYLDYMYNTQEKHFPDGSKWFIFPEGHDFGRTPGKVIGDQASSNHNAAFLANKSRWLLTACLPGMPLIFNGFEKIEWQPINLFSYGAVDWERDLDLREFISKVNTIRASSKALQKGSYISLDTNQGMNDNTQILAFVRRFYDDYCVVVVNMDVHRKAGPALVYLPDEFKGKYSLKDHLTGQAYDREGQQLLVELEPGDGHIFSVEFAS